MDRDRQWFERHPGRRHYVRFAEPVERFDLKHFAGQTLPPEAVVLTAVRQIAPGVRSRAWRAYSELPGNPDVLDEAGAKALWALWSGGRHDGIQYWDAIHYINHFVER